MPQPKTLFVSLVGASLMCLTLVSNSSGHADPRPMRSECIIGFQLDWSQVKAGRHGVRNSLHLGPEGAQRIKAQPAIAISQDGTRLYLQFRHDCEKKQDLAAEVMAFWQSKALDLPRFERIRGPIAPSPDTIEVWGPSWKDRPQDTRGAPK